MKHKRSDRSDIKLFERTRNGNGGLQVCRKAKKSDIGVRKLPASTYEKNGPSESPAYHCICRGQENRIGVHKRCTS